MEIYNPKIRKLLKKNDIKGLIKAIKSKNTDIQVGAIRAIEEIDKIYADIFVPELLNFFEDESLYKPIDSGWNESVILGNVIVSMSSFGEKAEPIIPYLIKYLKDNQDDERKRKFVIATFYRIGVVSIKYLRKLLKERSYFLKQVAALALRNFGWEAQDLNEEENMKFADYEILTDSSYAKK